MGFLFFKERRLMRLFLLVLLFSGIALNSSIADTLTEEDYKTWKSILGETAEKAMNGDANSQAIVGSLLLHGATGLEKNPELGLKFLSQSSEQGNANAMFGLFQAFENGLGVDADAETAVSWLQKSAEAGNRNSQFLLGLKYADGKHIEKNPDIAVMWNTKAAKKGQADAQNLMGVNYYSGYGTLPVDDIESYAWLDVAIKNPKTKDVRKVIEFQKNPAKNLSPDDLIKAKEKSDEYYKLYVEPYN